MRAKLRGNEGFTLTEMLAATIVVVLMTMIVATGSQAALKAYVQIVTEAEASTLCGTLTEAVCNELRYATKVKTDTAGTVTQYISQQYGSNAQLHAVNGRLIVSSQSGDYRLLSKKTYSSGLKCELSAPSFADGVFSVTLTILDSNDWKRQETTFSVAQLNPDF